ncbi:hypothetical protein Tco_0300069 [Tanacetum coccineum]
MNSENYKEDIDLWHIIVNGGYKPTITNLVTGKEEAIPYDKLKDENKKMLSKNDEAKMVLYNALPKKEYERIFMCKTAKDIWNSLVITHQGNKQVKDNKIDLFVQQYEQFSISDDETIDCAFARFNTIITSLKAFDESFLSRNHVRKFLRALPSKWRPKVTAIEESKDLSTLLLHELIGNLKVYKVVLEKDSKASKRISRNSLEEEENLFDNLTMTKRPSEEQRKKRKGNRNVGFWSDSDEDDDPKKDEICLMAHDSNKVIFDTPYYSSSLDDESLQNEYNKLCKISLRIINKNKHLKTKNEIIDNEVSELKERLKKLEKNKAISEECKSCSNLRSEIDSLSIKLVKFENISYFLQEMIENQRLQKDKMGLGFTKHRASTSEDKTEKIGQESAKNPSVDPAHPVPSKKVPASANGGYRASRSANEILKPILQSRSEFV